MSGNKLKHSKRIFSQDGFTASTDTRIYNLENNVYKVTYYEIISGASGTLSVPSQATINQDEFGLSGNALLSKINANNKPTYESPSTLSGTFVTASLNATTGDWAVSGAYTDLYVALIYSIDIKAEYFSNLDNFYVIETASLTFKGLQDLQNVTNLGNITTHPIVADYFVTDGGTSSDFVKGDGSLDNNSYVPVNTLDLQAVTDIGNITTNNIEANSFIKTGGSLNEFLKADGSIDNNTYLTSASVTGFVPYIGATTDVDLGIYDITAAHLIKDGGQSSQFLKADGSVDNNIYLTSADLPSTLNLYATTTASDIPGYFVLVRNIADIRFNTIAVDVSTGVITTTTQLVGQLITDANIISGNPGIFNITTIGNISRTSGTGQAEFFFRIYKRDSLGVETFITESDKTLPVTNGGYSEFSAIGLWNNGVFLDTDRVVIKYYADRLTSPVGSNPTYNFQFGGLNPVRSTAAIPVAVIPNIYLRNLADVENVDALNNEVLYWNDPASLWEHSLVIDLLSPASSTVDGYLSSIDWSIFNSKQDALGYTAEDIANKSSSYTLSSTTTYANTKALVDGLATKQDSLGFTPVPDTRNLTINGTTYDLTADRTWTISTASNVAIKDEGTTLTSAVTSINFTGASVTATTIGNDVTVNVSGTSSASNLFNYYNFT